MHRLLYNWVSRLRKVGNENIPTHAVSTGPGTPEVHDVVRLEPRRQLGTITTIEEDPERDTVKAASELRPTMELLFNGARLRVTNEVDPEVLEPTLRLLRGL